MKRTLGGIASGALLLLSQGCLAADESQTQPINASEMHAAMSMTKSFTELLAEMLIADGLLDPSQHELHRYVAANVQTFSVLTL